MITGHGGNRGEAAAVLGCRPEDIVDMSSNINPLGMPPGLLEHLRCRLEEIVSLPEADAGQAVRSMACLLGIDPGRMLMGTGTTQFIYTVCPALRPERVLIVGPTYADYASSCAMYGVPMDFFLARPEDDFQLDHALLASRAKKYDLVFICNPNNPTGRIIPRDELLDLCRSQTDTTFVVDESYLPFALGEQAKGMSDEHLDNVVVLWSISKIFGIPGLRAGFLEAEVSILERFSRFMQPWSANTLAQEAVVFLGQQKEQTLRFIDQSALFARQQVDEFQQDLRGLPVHLYPTVTPYLLIRLPVDLTAASVCDAMLQERLLLRNCANFYGLDEQYVRIALKTPEINVRAARHLRQVVSRKVEEG
ncbi:MAG: histidinol phosphate aminotransferase [Desulfobulbus propionicus]|nr:MAG: histidinol phosphate aminotransferase [Desulfobulbus propionicus]